MVHGIFSRRYAVKGALVAALAAWTGVRVSRAEPLAARSPSSFAVLIDGLRAGCSARGCRFTVADRSIGEHAGVQIVHEVPVGYGRDRSMRVEEHWIATESMTGDDWRSKDARRGLLLWFDSGHGYINDLTKWDDVVQRRDALDRMVAREDQRPFSITKAL